VIRPLEHTKDSDACDAVLATLPYHFGDPTGQADCAKAVRSERGWVAVEGEDVVGFVTVAPSSDEALEITWMAVRMDRRRDGIGAQLMKTVVDAAAGDGFRQLVVMTLGPSEPEDAEDSYEGTRRFYRREGFIPLKELGLRSWSNGFSLLLTRPL
jgi:GNAT superfamily N-acetyltransferase